MNCKISFAGFPVVILLVIYLYSTFPKIAGIIIIQNHGIFQLFFICLMVYWKNQT